VGSHRSVSGTASPVPAARTETPPRASHAGAPATGAKPEESAAAAETHRVRERRPTRAPPRGGETRTSRPELRARGAAGGAPRSEMAVAMEKELGWGRTRAHEPGRGEGLGHGQEPRACGRRWVRGGEAAWRSLGGSALVFRIGQLSQVA